MKKEIYVKGVKIIGVRVDNEIYQYLKKQEENISVTIRNLIYKKMYEEINEEKPNYENYTEKLREMVKKDENKI